MPHLDPVAHAAAYYEPRYATDEAQERAEAAMALAFIKACRECDANATAWFAPMVNDWERERRQPRPLGAPMPQRLQVLAEVLEESLDYRDGPAMAELMQLLLNVAFSADVVNAPAQARALLERMATKWAWINTDVEG